MNVYQRLAKAEAERDAARAALQELLDWSQSGHGWSWGPIYQSHIDHIAKIIDPVLHAEEKEAR